MVKWAPIDDKARGCAVWCAAPRATTCAFVNHTGTWSDIGGCLVGLRRARDGAVHGGWCERRRRYVFRRNRCRRPSRALCRLAWMRGHFFVDRITPDGFTRAMQSRCARNVWRAGEVPF